MAESNNGKNVSSSASINPQSGFCGLTKIYHSLGPHVPLPPASIPLSVTDFVFSLLHQSTNTAPAAFIDAATGRRISYPELVLRVKSLSACLQHRFLLSKGDCGFIISPNSVDIPILYLSLLSLGVAVSPANPISLKSEITGLIELSKPVIIFATSDVAHKIPSVRCPIVLLDSPDFASMMTSQTEKLRVRQPKKDVFQCDTATILYSSGTTGKIKGVMLSHGNIISSVAGVWALRQARASPAVTICVVPYYHIYGFNYLVRMVAFGECLVSMPRFDMRLMLKAIEEYKATHLALAPPVVLAMTNRVEESSNYDLSSLEVVVCGGAAVSSALISRFKSRFPNLTLLQAYGLTETTGGIARATGPMEGRKLGATGKLVSNCQAKIVDQDTGMGLPPFRQGELWIRGSLVMKGYVEDREATANAVDSEEGWLRSGDLCYFDDEGCLFFVDRIKELIKYKGYQVAPAELEHLLHSHPDIADAAVIPYPDEDAGQVPMAFVVKKPGSTIDEKLVMDAVAKEVAPYKKIRRVSFVNTIPKNATGKVLRKELIRLALSPTSASKL